MNDTSQTHFNTEGQPAFPVAETETDNSAESSTVEEETNTDQTQSDEGEQNSDVTEDGGEVGEKDKPFHEDPRWKEREEDWKGRFNDQETRHADDIQKLREEFGGDDSNKDDKSNVEIPSWFGGDANDWKDYLTFNKDLVNNANENIQSDNKKQVETEQKAVDDATDFMKTEISDIESDSALNPDSVKIDQNKLLKFVLDNELVDTKGRWNYRAGFQLMQAGVKSAKQATIDEKKQIASASTQEKSGAETEKSQFTTSEDFNNPSNRPW